MLFDDIYMDSGKVEPWPIKDVLDFCNIVREAGGANPLDSLMPAVPEDTHKCLIARNLNFSCEVMPTKGHDNISWWAMYLNDEETRDQIVEALRKRYPTNNFQTTDRPSLNRSYGFFLPPELAAVAYEFDQWSVSHIEEDAYIGAEAVACGRNFDYLGYLDKDSKNRVREVLQDEGISLDALQDHSENGGISASP
jgi:hypothetical protein